MAGARTRGRRTTEPTPATHGAGISVRPDPIVRATEQWRAERPDLDPAPLAVFGRIARIFALQRRAQASVHQPFGLSHAAFDMLANLRRSGAPHRKTATSLAKSSLISTGGVTFRMDGLEHAGLIRRVREARDRRVVWAELTDEGLNLIDDAIGAHFAMEKELLDALTPREQHQLVTLLTKLETALADRDHSGRTATEVAQPA